MPIKSFSLTTAIDYVNARPHLGHAYEKACADVIARWRRLADDKVFFLTGTDENAQKNVQAAQEAGQPVQQFVDENAEQFRKLCTALNISHDYFVRTTEQRHHQTAQAIFRTLHDQGDIYKGVYKGLYCVPCEAFYLEKDAPNQQCPVHGKRLEWLEEESYFFKLGKYHSQVLRHIKENPQFIQPDAKRREILNRLQEPLKDLSVSRQKVEWGVPVPFDEHHRIYVWFDALLSYISGLDYPKARFKQFWPASLHLIGVDIVWFHTVIWPAMLLAAGLPLPKQVFVHGFLTLKGEKMSKTRGNVVDPFDLVKRYGADQLRYYLLREVPFGQDGDFDEDMLKERINGELVADLGNLLNRVATLAERFDGKLEGKPELDKEIHLEKISQHMDRLELHQALQEIFRFCRICNKYINDTQPWKLQGQEAGNVLYNLAESLRIIGILIGPFLPGAAEEIRKQLGVKDGKLKDCTFGKFTGKIKKGRLLFEKV